VEIFILPGFLASWTLMSSHLGGLGARVDLLKQNFTLSMIGAATGVLFPIGLSYLLLYLGFGYGWFHLSQFLQSTANMD
jgi:Kef-type K+ transport system membrane component KefB